MLKMNAKNKEHTIKIVEVLEKVIKINAVDKESALAIAKEKYYKEDIILYPEDLKEIKFEQTDKI